jgi:hypothetical protein
MPISVAARARLLIVVTLVNWRLLAILRKVFPSGSVGQIASLV